MCNISDSTAGLWREKVVTEMVNNNGDIYNSSYSSSLWGAICLKTRKMKILINIYDVY